LEPTLRCADSGEVNVKEMCLCVRGDEHLCFCNEVLTVVRDVDAVCSF
jgi:hypothetical protein